MARGLGIRLLGVVTIAVAAIGCRADRFRDADLPPLTEVSMQRLANTRAKSQSTALHTSGETLAQRHLLPGPQSLQDYVHLALKQNPDILAARKRVESLAFRVPVARSLPDPALTTVAQPAPVQTAAGEFQFILNANQKFPWFGKLDARASLAAAEASVARAELAAVELDTVAKVKKACFELAYVEQAITVTQTERQLLEQLQSVATTRYETGQTTLQDVLRAELEIAALENSLISLRQRKIAERAKLARLLHLAPDTELEPPADLPNAQLPRDLESLRQQAVTARPQLHAAMTRISKERRAVELARLDYKPDVTLGFAWIDVADAGLAPSSNGQDAVLLTAGINLPIYRKRLDASVHSAEAGTVASARQYDSLKGATLEAVTELFAKAESHTQMLALFTDDILPKAEQTLEVSTQAYAVGDIDFLQLLDNWQQLLRYELGRERLTADLQQTLADLEQLVGGWTGDQTRLAPELEEVPLPQEPPPTAPLPEGPA